MPEFRIKNLMVDVVSAAKVPDLEMLCRYPTNCFFTRCFKIISCRLDSCKLPTPIDFCYKHLTPPLCWKFESPPPCWKLTSPIPCVFDTPPIPCPDGSIIPEIEEPIQCPGGSGYILIDLINLVQNPDVIEEVRVELDQVLNLAAERGVEINQAMAPQTKAQAEFLEAELQAALEEVQKLKGKLK